MIYDIKKNNKQILYYYEFDGVSDLINHIEKTPVNKEIFNQIASDKIPSYYCGGIGSVKEAIEVCKKGVNISEINDFIKLNKIIEELIPIMHQKRNIQHHLYGFRPDVSRSLRGNPKSMYHLIRNEQKKGLNLLLFPNSLLSASTEQINNLGVCVIQTVKLLESMGYDVSIYFLDLCFEFDNTIEEYLYTQIKIKSDSEIFNPIISYFPLCHPAFPRRILLRLNETMPFQLKKWVETVGRTIESVDLINEYILNFSSYNNQNKKIVVNFDVIKNNIIDGDDIVKDFSNFLEYINFESYLTSEQKEEYEAQNEKIKKLQKDS